MSLFDLTRADTEGSVSRGKYRYDAHSMCKSYIDSAAKRPRMAACTSVKKYGIHNF